MALDLDSLKVTTEAPLPKSARGREAAPLPDSLLQAVKASYSLPDGTGSSIKVPNGTMTEGKSENAAELERILRRCATALDLGISIRVQPSTKTTTEVLFKAAKKTVRTRRPKAQIEAEEQGLVWDADLKRALTEEESTERGYVWDETHGYIIPETTETG